MIGLNTGFSPVSAVTSFLSRRPRHPITYTLLHDATYVNTCPAGMIEDPLDSSKMLFYRSEFLGPTTVGGRISLYTFPKTDPYTLTFDSLVLVGSESSYDINSCRFGCPILAGSELRYYYVGVDSVYKWRICMATSTDGRSFTKQGVVLDYNDVDEKSISGPNIYIYEGTWYMIYSGWDGVGSFPNNNPGASRIGIKLATSSDGITWTETGTVLIPLGGVGDYDRGRVEDGILFRIENTWFIMYTGRAGDPSTSSGQYSIELAYNSGDINSAFTKVTQSYFPPRAGMWDAYLTACPYVYDFNGELIMYYQSGNGVPVTDAFSIGAARII